MDFFSAKGLVTHTGHEMSEWPFVIIKEGIDNALDECEEADISPVIEVTADQCGISVSDNGRGLPDATLKASLDFNVRVSSRDAYISPTRGTQGNALKTLAPMPAALDPEHGRFIVEAHGKRRVITCGFHPISQEPNIHEDETDLAKCNNPRSCQPKKSKLYQGTKIRLEWRARPESAWPFDEEVTPLGDDWKSAAFRNRFREIMECFALFNPHGTFTLNWFGKTKTWVATNPTWEKWRPNHPTSAHWYELRNLQRLIGAYITHDTETGADRLVSDFIGEFDGLSGSQKRAKVLEDAGMKRVRLSELVTGDEYDPRISALLAAMQRHTRPVKSQRLGIVGEDHMRTRLLEMGINPDSFRYSRSIAKNGLPWVLEAAFGWRPDEWRSIYLGANCSVALKNPFRSFGTTQTGLDGALEERKAGEYEPIIFVLHLAHPKIEYTDHGKSALHVGGAA